MTFLTKSHEQKGQERTAIGVWKDKATPEALIAYNKVKTHPKLSDCQCLLSVEPESGYKCKIIFSGSIDDCFKKAFETQDKYYTMNIQLPIGETTYNLIEFIYQEEAETYSHEVILPMRIIDECLTTISDLTTREIELVEEGLFTKDDIMNSIKILSEQSYETRFYDDNVEFSLFEDVAVEIEMHTSVLKAMEVNYEDMQINLHTPYEIARFKLFTRMLMWECQEQKDKC